jgi:tetratricopeptide (TPR) repeat protein
MAQGYPTGANLGDLTAARTSLERALALATALVASDPEDLSARRTLALAQEKLGDVMAWTGDIPGAVRHAREALRHWAHLAEVQPDSGAARFALAISTIKLGDLLGHPAFPNLGDQAGAERQYRRALALMEASGIDVDTAWGRRRQIALGNERLGAMLRLAGRYEEALAASERSLALREELYRQDGTSTNAARDVAVSRESLCQLQLARREFGIAMSHCGAAVALYRSLRSVDPGNAQGLTDLAIAESGLSQVLSARGRWTDALSALDRSSGLLREFLLANPGNARAGRELARNLLRSSVLHARLSSTGPAGQRSRLLDEAGALYASGRRALEQSLADGATVEDEADVGLSREAGVEVARALRARR